MMSEDEMRQNVHRIWQKYGKIRNDLVKYSKICLTYFNILYLFITGYKYGITTQMSWFSAQADCNIWGGHLVTLNNQTEMMFIADELAKRCVCIIYISHSLER